MISISLIGCGRISSKHIESVLANKERLRLVACCDPVIDRAQRRVQEYRTGSSGADAKVYADYREMLKKRKARHMRHCDRVGLPSTHRDRLS